MDRGKIVGQPTGGSTGQPLIIGLPGGGSARICSKRDRYPDGTEFIGVGVQHDVEVLPTIADTLEAIADAHEWIEERTGAGRAVLDLGSA
jgi:C-terminal processing protease CtpA/Prc